MKTPHKVEIGNNIFYIYHFGAFTAANISGDLTSIIVPVLASVAPTVIGALSSEDSDDSSIFDKDISTATPSLANALSVIDGNTLEKLLRKLLVKHRNISFETFEDRTVRWLDEDSVDELFAGEFADMILLAVEVLKLNFKGFFKKLGSQYGVRLDAVMSKMGFSKTTDTSTEDSSPTSN